MGAPIRAFLDEGEYVPGTTPQRLFYGIDQIGSVRRVFASTTSAPAYDYDAYGKLLSGTAPLTAIGYAGMWTDADSGLNLTHYRAYDPTTGRWLSRDPLGEEGEERTNLYAYVGGDPINWLDPTGESRKKFCMKVAFWIVCLILDKEPKNKPPQLPPRPKPEIEIPLPKPTPTPPSPPPPPPPPSCIPPAPPRVPPPPPPPLPPRPPFKY